MVSKKEIQEEIYRIYVEEEKYTDKRQLFGVFAIGAVNKGGIESLEDLDYCVILIPTLDEIACNCKFDIKQLHVGYNHWVFSIPVLFDLLALAQYNIWDIMDTEFAAINPLYFKNAENLRKIKKFNAKRLTAAITAILKQSFSLFGGEQDELFKSLTKTEEKALIYILETIGDEGILSISEAIRSSGISRPVFTSLLDKLSRYKGAEVKNMGVKGTYINFYDHILSKFEIT